jgi:uncharacterized membrane protein YgaE (UPF0421/DUF939 family)
MKFWGVVSLVLGILIACFVVFMILNPAIYSNLKAELKELMKKPEVTYLGRNNHYNVTDCERLCNQTYANETPENLESCWDSCRSFGTRGDFYSKYMSNITETKNQQT